MFDAIFGEVGVRLSASELLALIARLPEGSKLISMYRDPDYWREYLDIDANHYALAGIYNAINDNTRATANWGKKKPPTFDPWPTPSLNAERARKSKEKKPLTVSDLYQALGSGIPIPSGLKKE